MSFFYNSDKPFKSYFCSFCQILVILYYMEKFQIIKPSTLLSPYVKHYWFLEVDDVLSDSQRVVPTGNVELVFHRGSRMFSFTEGEAQPDSFISGQSTGFLDLIPTGKVDMISVTFHPQGARAFFPMPMSEFKDRKIALDSIDDAELNELRKRVSTTYNNEECVRLIENFLFRRLNISKEYNYKRMNEVVKAINTGEFSPVALAEISCLGYKQFQRVFSTFVGANPKDFLRVIRYQRALFILQHHAEINLAQLAFDCNYYDESHLIKDFKKFSGYTPTEYMAVCAPFSDYFSTL